jgi:CBS domain-containing protein
MAHARRESSHDRRQPSHRRDRSEATTAEPHAVPGASLPAVRRELAAQKYGGAVIVEGERPVGIVAMIDALRLCVELFDGGN